MDWREVIQLHNDAVKEFTSSARGIPGVQWAKSTADQWGPAHITEHLIRAYEILLKDLNGQEGMRLRTKFVTRQLLRWFLVPRLLRGAEFPRARAPRGTRPVEVRTVDQNEALETFQNLASRFLDEIQLCHQQNPRKKITHAYFGRSNLKNAILFCARHVQHHTKAVKITRFHPDEDD